MKMTLLTMVQKILSSMSSDEVNTIADTVESMQIVDIIEDVFYNYVTNNDIPEHEELLALTALSDSAKPNYMKIPANVAKIAEVWYNKNEDSPLQLEYREIRYLNPSEFLRRNSLIDTSDANVVQVTDVSGTKLAVRNNKMPEFWTTFDDEYLVFDSYKATVDATLQTSKARAISRTVPTFTRSDAFVMDIDDNLFPVILNEAKSWAHMELKQQPHAKAEQQSRRQRARSQAERARVTEENKRPDYGR